MYLGVAVLAGLGRGHVDDLAGATLDHHEATLAQSRALHGVGVRRAGADIFELVLAIRHGGKRRIDNRANSLLQPNK